MTKNEAKPAIAAVNELFAGSPDGLREIVRAVMQEMLEAEMTDALGADIRYVAPDARLSILEIKRGLVPGMSGIALMRDLARSDVIRELSLTGRVFSGAEALTYGFATRLHVDPLAAARATAKEIAGRSRGGARGQAALEHGERRLHRRDPPRRV
jgi:enoyl-CoA hydratase/carnithine racemase